MMKKLVIPAAFAALIAASAAGAKTVTYTIGDGNNECGQGGFSSCTLGDSPSIIKFNSALGVSDKNTSFPSVTGGEFMFSNLVYFDNQLIGLDWSYLAGANDPGITAAVVKAGNNWAFTLAVSVVGTLFSGTLNTLDAGLLNQRDNPQAISHITFFDSYVPPPPPPPPGEVPLPAAGWALLTALGGLFAIRHQKKA